MQKDFNTRIHLSLFSRFLRFSARRLYATNFLFGSVVCGIVSFMAIFQVRLILLRAILSSRPLSVSLPQVLLLGKPAPHSDRSFYYSRVLTPLRTLQCRPRQVGSVVLLLQTKKAPLIFIPACWIAKRRHCGVGNAIFSPNHIRSLHTCGDLGLQISYLGTGHDLERNTAIVFYTHEKQLTCA